MKVRKNWFFVAFIISFHFCLSVIQGLASEESTFSAMIANEVKGAIQRKFPYFSKKHAHLVDLMKHNTSSIYREERVCDLFTDLADNLYIKGRELLERWKAKELDVNKIRLFCHDYLEEGIEIVSTYEDCIFYSDPIMGTGGPRHRTRLRAFVFYLFFEPSIYYYSIARDYAPGNEQRMYSDQMESVKSAYEEIFSPSLEQLDSHCSQSSGELPFR